MHRLINTNLNSWGPIVSILQQEVILLSGFAYFPNCSWLCIRLDAFTGGIPYLEKFPAKQIASFPYQIDYPD